MKSIMNVLTLVEANWVSILVCLGLVAGIIKKTVNFFSKTKEERIEIAKTQITNCMLKMVSDAEDEYIDWNKAGAIKRSEVIAAIYHDYPILAKVVDQKELTKWIDDRIGDALVELEKVIKQNENE